MGWKSGIALAFLLSSAALHAEKDPLAQFTAISFPKKSLPIGAVWFQGTGPTGQAAEESNIEKVGGVSSSSISAEQKKGMTLALAKYLGLSGGSAKNLKAEYTELESYRVRDLFATGFSSGKSILREGIKAKAVTLITDASTALALKSNAEAKGISANIEAGSGKKSSVSLAGSDLFVAIGVVTFETHQGKVSQAPIDNTIRHRTLIGPYQVWFSSSGPCASSDKVDVSIMDVQKPDSAGSFAPIVYTMPSGAGTFSVPLPVRTFYTQQSSSVLTVIWNPDRADNGPNCDLSFPVGKNYLELLEVTTVVVPLKKPVGL